MRRESSRREPKGLSLLVALVYSGASAAPSTARGYVSPAEGHPVSSSGFVARRYVVAAGVFASAISGDVANAAAKELASCAAALLPSHEFAVP